MPSGGGGSLLAGHGSGYQAVGSGYQESEGANLDPSLLHKIEEILLDQENQIAAASSQSRKQCRASYHYVFENFVF